MHLYLFLPLKCITNGIVSIRIVEKSSTIACQ
uniref:Uncharacterized protein n=1 Tax=Myoviridae sp. ctkfK18 TaxID=2825165 RepID=A0A8S5VGN1_9CAUD|nr:MAG TPA: hypothetical protein [Myoviridae sp. ctkfK18]